ncbi:MAG TPA: 4-hydroxy-tetrahydrodipicolinate synthase [Bacillota bacterium]|nr:4-hydroxy-tetrahydrodipicolinate synthase [Bacillota bacterium]
MNFGEVITAMVTPFDEDLQIDYSQLKMLIQFLINNGTDAIIVSGTTGESPTLSSEEKLDLFHHSVEIVGNRIPVIAGTSTYHTKESIYLTKEAEQIGCDGIMAVTPYYNRPNQKGLYRHFSQLAKNTKLPIMLYNVPSRTGVDLQPKTVISLSDIPNITSIKEASGNLEAVSEIIANTRDNFTVYSGDDSLTLPILSVGGFGVVSVASHVYGHKIKQMITNYNLGNTEIASEIHKQLLPFMLEIFNVPSPAPIKFALNHLGVDVGNVREPLLPLNETEKTALTSLLV